MDAPGRDINNSLIQHAAEILDLLLSAEFPGVEAFREQRKFATFEADEEWFDVNIDLPDGLPQAQTSGSIWPVEIRWDSLGLSIVLTAHKGYMDSLFWNALPCYLSLVVPPLRDGRLVVTKRISETSWRGEYVDGGTYLKLPDGTALPEPPPVDWTNPEVNRRWSHGGYIPLTGPPSVQ